MNNANLIQAIRGPVMMITLGVLFLIDHYGRFGFGSTWPLLVIIFGVLKLAERAVATPQTEPPTAGQGGSGL